jgi:hypothetical protein
MKMARARNNHPTNQDDHGAHYLPTAEEIAERSAQVQATWTAKERIRRQQWRDVPWTPPCVREPSKSRQYLNGDTNEDI